MFKSCACCHHHWPTAQDFVQDSELTFIGIQEDKEPQYNAACFLCSCGTSLYVMLTDLIEQTSLALRQLLAMVGWRGRDMQPAAVVGMLARALESLAKTRHGPVLHAALLKAG